MRSARLAISLLSVLVCLRAQQLPHTIRATGDATVSVQPDRAVVSFTVESQAPTAKGAAAQNARKTGGVVSALRSFASLHHGTLRTVGYSLTPNYVYDQTAAKQVANGFRSANTIEVVLDDVSSAGDLLDTGTTAGATGVNGITFTLRDDSDVRGQALARAAEKARDSASNIAKALNLHVTGILTAETNEAPSVRPLAFERAAAVQSSPTPIEVGAIEVRASVTVTVAVE